ERGPEPEHHGGERRTGHRAIGGREHSERESLHEHPGDYQRLAADSVRPRYGGNLSDSPDSWVEASDQTDLPDAVAVRGQVERNQAPRERVVEVVHETGLRARAQARVSHACADQRLA